MKSKAEIEEEAEREKENEENNLDGARQPFQNITGLLSDYYLPINRKKRYQN